MSSMDLVEFLTARLDEDEQVAREATPGPWSVRPETRSAHSMLYGEADVSGPGGRAVAQDRDGGCASTKDAAHIARHDPARVLADVAAKRLLLDRWTALQARINAEPDPEKRERLALTRHWLDMFAYQLGTVYADHPDYQPEWKP